MKKKILVLATVCIVMILSMTGCVSFYDELLSDEFSSDEFSLDEFSSDETTYCQVSGCPSEALAHRSYCSGHKCINFSCDNEAMVSFGYCEECTERAYK